MSTSTDKTWGTSIRRHLCDDAQLEEIAISAGGFSSIHRHQHKDNLFVVVEGRLLVRLFDAGKDTPWKTIALEPGQNYCVRSGQTHQFFAETNVRGFELYWPSLPSDKIRVEPDDIIRESENGVDRNYANSPMLLTSRIKTRYCCVCNEQLPKNHIVREPVFWAGAQRDMCDSCRAAKGL